jgi:ADP-heptose:LPS heptosyltransferase
MCAALNQFYERTKSARKIIVIDLGFLGDSVHLIPALYEIKRHYPEAALHTWSANVGAEVLSLVPCVDKAWTFPLTAKSPGWWRHWDIIRALRQEKFAVAFNFSGADRTIFLTALTGAKWRLAYQGGRKHFWNRWFISNWVPRQTQEMAVFEQRRQVLAAAGFSLAAPRFDMCLPEQAGAAAANIPANSMHLSINASTPMNEWPLPHWADLAKMLLASDPSVHLVATAASHPRESERLRQLGEAVPDARLIRLEGLKIGQLAAVVRRCRIHFGVDSGVLHLAMAMGVPTLSLFRKSRVKLWLPPGPQHRYLAASCPCLDEGKGDCFVKNEPACFASITAAQVFEASRSMRTIPAENLNL